MKFKSSLLLLPLLLIGGLTSCGEEKNPDQVIVDKYANATALLMDETGSPLIPGNHYFADYGDYYLGLPSQKLDDGRILDIKWSGNVADKPITIGNDKDTRATKITPIYVFDENDVYDLVLTATVTIRGVEGIKATTDYNINIGYAVPKESTLPQLVKDHTAGKIDPTKTWYYKFDAQITGSFDPTNADMVGKGLTVQDGDHAMKIFGAKLPDLYNKNTMKPGTKVHIEGIYENFKGMAEVKPEVFEVKEAAEVAEPTTFVLNSDNSADVWNGATMKIHQSRLMSVTGVIQAISKQATAESSENFNLKVGSKTVIIRINKYLGKNALDAFYAKVGAAVGKTATILCTVGWYNGPQGQLQWVGNTSPADCVTILP